MRVFGWIKAVFELQFPECFVLCDLQGMRWGCVAVNSYTIVKVVKYEGELEYHFLVNYGKVSRKHRHIISVCHVILLRGF